MAASSSSTSSTTGGGGAGGAEPAPCDLLAPGLEAVLDAAYASESLVGGVALGVSTPSCTGWAAAIGDPALTPAGQIKAATASQMLVAATVLRLVDEGLMGLDDTIEAWQPSVPNAATITVRHLLQHVSGLTDYNDNQTFVNAVVANPKTVWTPAELIQFSTELGATSPPGQLWDRTFVDYVILGTIIEAVTSDPVHVVIRERIIEPLGLTSTFLPGPEGDLDKLVPGYNQNGTNVGALIDSSFWWVSLGYVSTVEELVILTRGILADNLLSPASRAEMSQSVVSTSFPGLTQGLGVFVDGPQIGQEGAIPGFEVRNYYHPGIDAVVVIAASNDDWGTLTALYDAFAALDPVR